MREGRRWFVLSVCGIALVAVTGCKGFESRNSRVASALKAQNEAAATRNAELEARLAAAQTEQQNKDKQLAAMNAKLKVIQDQQAAAAKTAAAPKTLTDKLKGIGKPILTASGEPGVLLTSDILFNSGKCDVKPTAKSELRRLAEVIKEAGDGYAVHVDGHTDSDPLRVTKPIYKDNNGLGAARAEAVAAELVAMGVPKDRLVTRSFGQDRPIADNKTADGKKKNRRVEIIFAENKVVRASVAPAGS